MPIVRAPVSFSQRRLWLLDRLLPVRTLYNVGSVRRLSGELDANALRRALNELLRRHEILRTRFVVVDGEPVQEIMPEAMLPLTPEDLGDLPPAERESEARRRAAEEAQTEFDLERGPLFRARLLRLAPGEHWLQLTMHHIVSDRWSGAVLAREVAALYAAFCRGEASPLAELPVQYADFAAWQREWLQGEVLARQLAYWRSALKDLPVLELPTDRPRPAIPSYRGARVSFEIDPARTRALKALARQESATLFMTVLAAFQVLLSRYSGQEDIVVGAPIAGRRRHELAGLIGFFVNTLVLRGDLSGDPSFRAYLRRVRESALSAYAHQDLPFETLVEELAPKRDPSRNPLFQVALGFQNTAPIEWRLPGLDIELLEGIGPVNAPFDLTLSLREADGALRAGMDYARDLFAAETIERMVRQLATLLDDIVADPERPVSRLRLMNETDRARTLGEGDNVERSRVLADWNAPQTPYAEEDALGALFSAQVRRTPAAIAVCEGERVLSYAELDRRAGALARRLRDLGVAPGARVGLCMERSIEELVAVLGVLKAGCPYVPLDPWHPPERIAAMLRDADAAAVVTTRAAERALARARAGSARPVVFVDDSDAALDAVRTGPELAGAGEDPAYVVYTSGSTGEPKGVVIPQRAVVRLVRDTDYLQLGPDDVVAHLSNPAFDAATFEIWGALLNGARLVVVPRDAVLSPTALAATLDRYGVTALFVTTALFNLVARDAPRAFAGRVILFGGEAVDPRWVAAALATGKPKRLLHVYGPTETTTFATWHEVHAVAADALSVPIGRPIANTEVYVLDRNGEPVPPGVPGEIYIGGPGLATGYLGRPELTAERFVAHPFAREPEARLYRTGDRARYMSDGAIEFLGRMDRQVKIRGHRVEPGEVETALRALPQVRDATIVVRGDTAETRRLTAYVVVAPGSAPAPADLLRHLRRRLPGYMMPAALVLLPAFPLTANGKVDRDALPDPDALAAQRTGAHVPPRDPLEHMLATIWERLLGVRDIGMHDSFFDLGGHSLLAAQMMDEVERVCGASVPLTTLFTEATIAHLARALRGQVASTSPVVAVRAEGTRPPLFFLHGDFSGGGFYCHALARELGAEQPFYAVHPHGLIAPEVPASVEAMAADLLAAIRRARPHGPYLIGGHCNGALVAVEIARLLLAQGEAVPLVLVLDAKAPWRPTRVFETIAVGEASPRARSRSAEREPQDVAPDAEADIFARYRRAMAHYAPARVPVRIAVLRSAELEDFRPNLGWSSVGEEVETHAIPGDHLSSITRHVAETAARIAACVDAALGTERSRAQARSGAADQG
ncbi:MAG TPA: amino acid adenylation domain-containing protein [Casimicrobiaceae bacterium]